VRTKPALWAAALIAGVVAICSVWPAAGGHSFPLRVVVVPSKTEIHAREPFALALRVENISQTNQTIRVMCCSWQDEWKSSNPKIGLNGCECIKNLLVNIEIPPGDAYTNLGEMLIFKPIRGKTLSFRMGFTSIGSKETIWSDEVKLPIIAEQKGVQSNAIPKQSSSELDFLADIPSLKEVSLKISEAELLSILHRQKLEYKRSIANDQTTYDVQPKAHVVVIFGFREGQCTGIQRMQD
jgi:hypothetical protein